MKIDGSTLTQLLSSLDKYNSFGAHLHLGTTRFWISV